LEATRSRKVIDELAALEELTLVANGWMER
jgi:hypothetical protein